MNRDASKTRTQLLHELEATRKRLAELSRLCNAYENGATAFGATRPSLPDLNFIYDLEGRYIDVLDNQHQLIVYPEIGELKGSLIHNVLPRDVADMLIDTIRRSADSNSVETVEYQLEVPAGVRWFEGRLAPIGRHDSKPESVLLVSRDITERKKLEIAQAHRIIKLQQELEDMRASHQILPICSYCHRVRDDEKHWQDLAFYLHRSYGIKASHGICPVCMLKHYPDYAD